jgi:hypothetical protein
MRNLKWAVGGIVLGIVALWLGLEYNRGGDAWSIASTMFRLAFAGIAFIDDTISKLWDRPVSHGDLIIAALFLALWTRAVIDRNTRTLEQTLSRLLKP